MMKAITLNSSSKQAFTTVLGDLSFRFRVRWSTVMGAWYLDVSKPDGTRLLSGQRLVVNWPIRVGDPSDGGFPSDAFLLVVDQSGTNAEPTRDSFGSTHHILWMTESEAQSVGS
jgi:hypothetical protein